MRSGPLALFDAEGFTMIITPLDNFMAASFWHKDGTVNWGIMGGVDSVPANFEYSTLLYAGSGINEVNNN